MGRSRGVGGDLGTWSSKHSEDQHGNFLSASLLSCKSHVAQPTKANRRG
jgi:hypothetical protein